SPRPNREICPSPVSVEVPAKSESAFPAGNEFAPPVIDGTPSEAVLCIPAARIVAVPVSDGTPEASTICVPEIDTFTDDDSVMPLTDTTSEAPDGEITAAQFKDEDPPERVPCTPVGEMLAVPVSAGTPEEELACTPDTVTF